MNLTEEARIRLIIDGKEASNNLEVMGAKLSQLKDKFKDLEKGTKEWSDTKKEIKELEAAMKDVASRMDINQMTVRQLEKYQRELVLALKDTVKGTEDYVATADKLKEVNTRLGSIREDFKSNTNTVNDSKGVWTYLKGWIIGAFAVEAVVEFGKRILAAGIAIFELTGKFERYETILKNALGGQEEAIAAMKMIKQIAAETPISVDEMTDSFIKMVNRGLTPTKAEIKNLADLAFSQGKSFDQLTEAVLDAMMGEGERLKEFGIKMKKSGDDISLSFKGQVVHVKNNEEAIYGAIVAMGAYNGVAGTTSDVSKTLEGRVSNLGDAWDFIQVTLGDKLKPVFNGVLDLFVKGVEWLGKLLDASGPVGEGFKAIWSALSLVWEMGVSLFLKLLPDGVKNSLTLENAMKALGTILSIVGGTIKLVFSSVQLLIDSFIVLGNAGKVAISVLKGDFEGASQTAKALGASWEVLKTNASKNFGSITDSFKNIWTTTKGATNEAADEVNIYGKVAKATSKELTEEEKKELAKRAEEAKKTAQKRAEEEKKTNAELIKDIDAAWADSIKDELQRNKVKLQQKYELEVQAVEKSVASEKVKAARIEQLTKDLIKNMEKLDVDYSKAQIENEKQVWKIINGLWADSIKDELQAKKDKLKVEYQANLEAIEKSKASEQTKDMWFRALYDKYMRDMAKIDKDYNDDRVENNRKALAEIGKLESKGKDDKIKGENDKYAAEKERIEKLKIDEDIRIKLLAALEKAHLETLDGLKKESADKEIETQKQKYDAISRMMNSDLYDYMRIAAEKIEGLTKFKFKSIESFTDLFKEVGRLLNNSLEAFGAFFTAVTMLQSAFTQMKINNFEAANRAETEGLRNALYDQEDLVEDYELRIAKLKLEIYNEKDAARKADLQAELERLEREKDGVVLNKDVTTKEIEKIERDYAKKIAKLKLEEWNRQKKLEIGMAIINGAQAFLKALAGAPPPVNFVMAGVVAAATAIQVGIIKSQVPPDFGDTGDIYVPGQDAGTDYEGSDPGLDGNTTNEMPSDSGGGGKGNPGDEQSFGDGGVLTDDSYFVNNGVLGGLGHDTPEGGNWVINPRTGKLLAKVESGEFMGVFSREVTRQHEPLLRHLANSSLVKTGKPVYAAEGYFGNISDLEGSAADASYLAAAASKDLGAINEQTAELIDVMMESKQVLGEVKDILKDIAVTSRITSEKNFSINIRNIIEVADEIAEVANQSSFG